MLVGRGRELGTLRSAFDSPTASVVTVSGPAGSGKSGLARRATEAVFCVYHRCPPLPDPSQREFFLSHLLRALPDLGLPVPPGDRDPGSWPELLKSLRAHALPGGAPLVVVFDDAHRLTEARSRLGPALTEAMATFREGGHPIHIVLVGPPDRLPARPLEDPAAVDVRVGPLTFRSVAGLLPGTTPKEKLEAYGVFGGMPGTLRHVDAQATLTTNIQRLLLTSDAALADAGITVLERDLQTPSRYAAILATLAQGESTWSSVHAGVTDVTTSGQVAPYLRRLEEMGLVEVRRSLDAKPKNRNRRYRIVDPFLAFWYRMASLTDWGEEAKQAVPGQALRDTVQSQAAAVFPEVCRQFMDYDAREMLTLNARECGSLWGPHSHIEVAGILRSGAAFYGRAKWSPAPDARDLRALDRSIRETRYGFGREARLRILFGIESVSAETARTLARRHDTFLVSAHDLAGTEAGA